MRKLIIPPAPDSPGSLGDQAILLVVRDGDSTLGVQDVTHPFWNKLRYNRRYSINHLEYSHYDEIHIYPTDTIDGAFGPHCIANLKKITDIFLGKPIYLHSFSWGPNPITESINYIKQLNASFSVRDQYSFDRFTKMFPSKKLILEEDPAFLLPTQQPRNPVNIPNKSIGVCPTGNSKINYFEIVNLILSKGYNPVVFPHDLRESTKDVDLATQLSSQYNCLLLESKDSREIKFYINQMSMLISGRMHAAIAALSLNVPVYAFDYNNKMHGVFKTRNKEHFIINHIDDINFNYAK